MMRFAIGVVALGAIVIALLFAATRGYGPIVITDETQHNVVTRFGEPVKIITTPGLDWKIPFFDNVKSFDRRLHHINADPVERLISNGERLIIDYYVVWRIKDPVAFMKAFPLGELKARDRIQETINSIVSVAVGELDQKQILQRSPALKRLVKTANVDFADDGVEFVDVRINRTELTKSAGNAAYEQMREERRALARDFRVKGERQAREIRAEAEKQARTTLAEAQSFAEVTRGEGDAEAAKVYASAYGKDPEFYAFWRSLQAYKKTLGKGTTLVLPPDHEFFRYLAPGPPPGR